MINKAINVIIMKICAFFTVVTMSLIWSRVNACHDIAIESFIACTNSVDEYKLSINICVGEEAGLVSDNTCGLMITIYGALLVSYPEQLFFDDANNSVQLMDITPNSLLYGTMICQGSVPFIASGVSNDCISQIGNDESIELTLIGYPSHIEIAGFEDNECSELIPIPQVESPTIVFDDAIICSGDSLLLDAYFPNCHYLWQDGSTNSKFYADTSGVYEVVVDNGCELFTFSCEVSLYPEVFYSLPVDTFFCQGSNVSINLNPQNIDSLKWGDGNNSNEIQIDLKGMYYLTLYSVCGLIQDSLEVKEYTVPNPLIPDTLLICDGVELMFQIQERDSEWIVNFDDAGDQIYVNQEGIYDLSIDNQCGQYLKQLVVLNSPYSNEFLPQDTMGCNGEPIIIGVDDSSAHMIWDNGQLDNFIAIYQEGNYSAELHVQNCVYNDDVYIIFRECEDVMIPSAFSPNGDGINDVFLPLFRKVPDSFYMQIYNRWGQKVFESDNPLLGWNGSVKGKTDVEAYIYKLSFSIIGENGEDNYKVRTGSIILIQ